MMRAVALSLLVLLAANVCDAQEGRLSSLRDDVNRAPSSASPATGSNRDNEDSFLGSLLGALFCGDDGGPSVGLILVGAAALSPFYVPAHLLGDRYDHRMYFAPYPYANQYLAYQIVSLELAPELYRPDTENVERNDWAMRLSVENGNDFAGINRLNGQFKFEHANRFGINTNWNWFVERLPCGCIDETLISDTNVTFRFAQHERGSLYTGVGLRMLTDRHQSDFGFNFTYGGDWFPVQPIVASAVFDAGTLGNAGVVHGRASIGAIWHGWELFTGYDFLRIGHVSLQGPMVGVRWWF